MALNTKMADAAVNAEANSLTALANSGLLRIYDGTQAATADTAIGAQVLLAELTMNATSFGSASAGVITANAVTTDSSANNTGTATWFRLVKSDGTTSLWDGSVGTSGANMNINSTAISSGAAVSVTSFTHTVTK